MLLTMRLNIEVVKAFDTPDCMSQLPAPTAALNTTATMDVDVSIVSLPNPSSQKFPSFNSDSHTPRAQPSHSTTIPRDTIKSNQIDDEQSGVKHGHEAGAKKTVRLMMSSLRSEMAANP